MSKQKHVQKTTSSHIWWTAVSVGEEAGEGQDEDGGGSREDSGGTILKHHWFGLEPWADILGCECVVEVASDCITLLDSDVEERLDIEDAVVVLRLIRVGLAFFGLHLDASESVLIVSILLDKVELVHTWLVQ